MKIRCLIVHVPRFPFMLSHLMPPLGLAEIAGSLINCGYDCRILDYGNLDSVRFFASTEMHTHVKKLGSWWEHKSSSNMFTRLFDQQRNRFEKEIQASRNRWYDSICDDINRYGVSDILFFHAEDRAGWLGVRAVANALRKRGHAAPMFVFGSFAEKYAAYLLDSKVPFDGICVEDADEVLSDLTASAAHPEFWRNIPNLILWRYGTRKVNQRKRKLSQQTFAADAYRAAVYQAFSSDQKILLPTIRHARGGDTLAHALPECYWYRRNPIITRASLIAEQIGRLAIKEKYRYYHIQGAGAASQDIDDLANALTMLQLPIQYSREVSIPGISSCEMGDLYSSGCRSLGVRVATGSQRLLEDFFGCSFGMSEAESAILAARKHGMHNTLEIIYPAPVDDYHSFEETIRLIRRCVPNAVNPTLPQVLPGSSWWRSANAFGFKVSPQHLEQWASVGDNSLLYNENCLHLHYNLCGQNKNRTEKLGDEFRSALEVLGLGGVTVFPRDALVAQALGYLGNEVDFCALAQHAICSLDISRLEMILDNFNRSTKDFTIPDKLHQVASRFPHWAVVGN